MKKILLLTAILFTLGTAGTANAEDAGCDARIETCNTSGGVVDGSLNTNSGNQNSNNSTNSSTNVNTNSNNDQSIDQSTNGDYYTVQGGTQVVNESPANTTHTTTTKIDTNQVGNAVLSNLVTSGQDTCLGSATAGASIPGLGAFGGGSTTRDENCELIKQVKLLASLGLKDAAVCLMYQNDKTFANAIASAYPQLTELCDPNAKAIKAAREEAEATAAAAEAERLAKLAKYEAAGLEPPAHLLTPIVAETVNITNVTNDGYVVVDSHKDMEPQVGNKYDYKGKRFEFKIKNGILHKCRVNGTFFNSCHVVN